jgi:hypothetical protein
MQSHETSERANEGKIHNSPAEKKKLPKHCSGGGKAAYSLELDDISCLIYADSNKNSENRTSSH